jgi:hypothetical protein
MQDSFDIVRWPQQNEEPGLGKLFLIIMSREIITVKPLHSCFAF